VRRRGHWLFAIAGGLSGHTATPTATLVSAGHTALTHISDFRAFRLRGSQLRQITEDQTIRKPRRDVGLLTLGAHRNLDGRPDRSAGIGLQDLPADDCYLLCPDELSPAVDDRPHRNVLTLRGLSADASAS
jgi:serine/threonine protein phosphatase PrpC